MLKKLFSVKGGFALVGLVGFVATTNPFLSKLSRISYVLERGTSEILLNSPAVLVPRESKAVHIFTS